MIVLLVFLLVYIGSVFWLRYEFIKEYTGILKMLSPDVSDVIIVFIPIINTIWAALMLFDRIPNKFKGKFTFSEKWVKKFFGLDKNQ